MMKFTNEQCDAHALKKLAVWYKNACFHQIKDKSLPTRNLRNHRLAHKYSYYSQHNEHIIAIHARRRDIAKYSLLWKISNLNNAKVTTITVSKTVPSYIGDYYCFM